VRSMVLRLRTNAALDGRLPKKHKCDSHRQSDDPNPVKGMDAPRCTLRHCAQRCSQRPSPQQYRTSSELA
jgi:hypothetical protein